MRILPLLPFHSVKGISLEISDLPCL